ncbi:hypothetical protein [Actinomyces urogenitalis]|uniref:hypothetical protein n=1 Tax=Actinomyces urogenitalis TaxID=103621 RepID=UPI001896E6FF|nr:hypothetical protein [Actinomyces urogenitalis]
MTSGYPVPPRGTSGTPGLPAAGAPVVPVAAQAAGTLPVAQPGHGAAPVTGAIPVVGAGSGRVAMPVAGPAVAGPGVAGMAPVAGPVMPTAPSAPGAPTGPAGPTIPVLAAPVATGGGLPVPGAPTAVFGTAATPEQAQARRGPMLLIYISMAASVLAILACALQSSAVVAVFSWLLAGVVGLGLGCAFLVRNAMAQVGSWYAPSLLPTVLYRVSVVLGVAGIVLAALRFALVIGRL